MHEHTKLARFFRYITIKEDGCWEWIGYVSPQGYGRFTQKQAHCASYELFIGPKPPGYDLDHICHTKSCVGGMSCLHRRCVNPQHLELVTRKENLARGHHNNRDRTHCRRGHKFTPENTTVTTKGSRQCISCVKLRNKGPRVYTACKKGHPFDGRNKKQQICKVCARDRNRVYRQRLKLTL